MQENPLTFINNALGRWLPLLLLLTCLQDAVAAEDTTIDRKALVNRHNPSLKQLDPKTPLTLGNGKFAFTADVTGLQSLYGLYYEQGTPIETKARWAWHSRENKSGFTLKDAMRTYDAYGIHVPFPTEMDTPAGQWLRQNPHDLPLARVGLTLNGEPIAAQDIANIEQTLDLWRGQLVSQYTLREQAVNVETAVHGERDVLAVRIHSELLRPDSLGLELRFPRGYKLDKKNTPAIDWQHHSEHTTQLIKATKQLAIFSVNVDDSQHFVQLSWGGNAQLTQKGPHRYLLQPERRTEALEISIEFTESQPATPLNFDRVQISAASFWNDYWRNGAVVSLAGSKHPQANELERRLLLSQYLLGAQAQADIPAQETGLTSSSWYGKHHTEMMWWHAAHWISWNRHDAARKVLDWFAAHMDNAKTLARSRGLAGARWAKMVGPNGRESPGGNPLIIWNQPQPIHLAEMLYQHTRNPEVLKRYASLVENTAQAMSSMLVWEAEAERYSLLPPIWIAQEIYEPTLTKNPAFELSYWRYGLSTAQKWRQRLGRPTNSLWAKQLRELAPLPQRQGKYVAIESIPDTFSNRASRHDHPTMLAPWGLLHDPTVKTEMMQTTLDAVLKNWDWEEKIWGWDYPMIAMTAVKLGDTQQALEILLKDAPHNEYLNNGHCPQPGANLPVYLPANGALLSAMAMIVRHWDKQPAAGWQLQAEGFQ